MTLAPIISTDQTLLFTLCTTSSSITFDTDFGLLRPNLSGLAFDRVFGQKPLKVGF